MCSGARPATATHVVSRPGPSAQCRAFQEDTMNRLPLLLMAVLALGISSPMLAQKAAKPGKLAVSTTSSDIINLNTASAAQIATLPGIGPKTADLIIQYRQKNGGFKKVEEIMNVRGVGEKSFLKLKSRITVTPMAPPKPENK